MTSNQRATRSSARAGGDVLDGRDIVYFSILDWWYHSRSHADFQLALELAHARKVPLVNSIGMRFPTPRSSRRAGRRLVRKLASTTHLLRRPVPSRPNFHVYSPIIFPLYSNRVVRGLSAWAVRVQLRTLVRRLRLVDPIFIITVPTAWEVVAPLNPQFVVYNRSDVHSEFPEADREVVVELETALMRRGDLVLYVNSSLMEEERPLTGDRSYLLGHGVDLEAFRLDLETPQEIERIPRPRIGLFGDLRERCVDFPLLLRLADELPDVQLVLIGDQSDTMQRLPDRPNIHLLGQRDYVEVAALATGFDVALVPYRRSPWVMGSNPIKLNEYLALGLPIVSTDFPAAHDRGDLIQIAGNADEFVRYVEAAIEAGAVEDGAQCRRRHQAVEGSSWLAKAEELEAEIARRLGA